MHCVMGMAGHIDHGKTSLVKALTGVDCDRLPEEKKRGITIELGFTHLNYKEMQLGIIDVPGHEKFVKNMVAGAAGIDFVLLVVAADEGIMPQTREHLEICSLLGITQGLVALTKTDVVDTQWLDMVHEELADYLRTTFLAQAPVIPVSAHKENGLQELKNALLSLAQKIKKHSALDLLRLPIDRVFSMKGFGTVLTGTLLSGMLAVGDEIALYPQKIKSKVRGLQSHGEQEKITEAGRRVAVNLAGVEVNQLSRGNVLTSPNALLPAREWDIKLRCLPSSPRPLKHRKEVHFHHGTREVLARIYFLDRDELQPGESALCRVRFNEDMVGVWGDHVVLRSFSPLQAIAGGQLINPLGRKIKRSPQAVKQLTVLAQAESAKRVLAQLDMSEATGLAFTELLVLTGLNTKILTKILTDFCSTQQAVLLDKEEQRYISGSLINVLKKECLAFIETFHASHPMKQGITRGELASSWGIQYPPKLIHLLTKQLIKTNLLVRDAELLALPKHNVLLGKNQKQLHKAVLNAYIEQGNRPPNQKELLTQLEVTAKEAAPIYTYLQEQGELLKVTEGMFFYAPVLHALKDIIIEYLQNNTSMTAPEFKNLCGLSRKYAIPILEWMDKEKITLRVGDARQLRKNTT